jgi:uracil-DNA glycosylase
MRYLYEQFSQLPQDWQQALRGTFESESCRKLANFLQEEVDRFRVYPPTADWFNALKFAHLSTVKVVILGQDPYHGLGQAHGLSFSVPAGEKLPPSLINIYKALEHDLGIAPAMFGDLSYWAKQGVLLLNTVLTVREGAPNSHANHGWEEVSDAIIRAVNQQNTHVVFLLWGSHAAKKEALIAGHHTILKAAHPSPLSAYRGFLECKHFSRANDALLAHCQSVIDWELP